jgi:hypothetical protein
MKTDECVLFSGAANGAESEFGAAAERRGIDEVNFTFEGHNDARSRGIRVLTHEELKHGDVSLAYVSNLMHRRYPDTPLFKKVLQSIWHQVNSGQEIYVIGKILDDGTVKGGTGWGAEFAKLCNKPLYVFDQGQGGVRASSSRRVATRSRRCSTDPFSNAAPSGVKICRRPRPQVGPPKRESASRNVAASRGALVIAPRTGVVPRTGPP